MLLITNILSLLGSLGLFLFGMTLMNKALQKFAGLKLKSFLSGIASNKFKSISAGIVVTGVIQSSSAFTVIIIGLVNAGLLSLSESIGLIMGSNIGTTITAWLLAFGYNESILVLITLPIIGLALPFIFSSNNKRVAWGEFIIGFALLFLGLQFIQSSVPNISDHPEMLSFIKEYINLGPISILIFLAIGFIITLVLQSSSATIALTFVLYAKGFFGIELAAAMILGENIGTTITANIAAIVANKLAKRAALSHTLFNIFGVTWVVFLLPFIIKNIGLLISNFELNELQVAFFSLAMFHSIFNILNTFILINFVPILEKITTWFLPIKAKENQKLKYLARGIFATSEISLLQTKRELSNISKTSIKMFQHIRVLFSETNDVLFKQAFKYINDLHKQWRSMQVELSEYLTRISEKELSKESSTRIRIMFKTLDEIESIISIILQLAKTIKKKKKQKIWFTQNIRNSLNNLFDIVEEVLSEMNIIILDEEHKCEKALLLENNLNKLQKELRKKQIKHVEKQKYTYHAGIIYNEIIMFSEQLGNHAVNISQSICKKQ